MFCCQNVFLYTFYTVCLPVYIALCSLRLGLVFADKTLQAKPLQHRQGLRFPGERSCDPCPGASPHLTQSRKPSVVWDTCVVHGKSPGRHNHPALLGKPMKRTGAGRVKGWVSKGKSHLKADEAWGFPALGLCSGLGSSRANPLHLVPDTLCTAMATLLHSGVKSTQCLKDTISYCRAWGWFQNGFKTNIVHLSKICLDWARII